MKKYILLYGDKKPEDNICLLNMFDQNKKINLGWTDFDYNSNMKEINELVKDGVEELIFAGLEIGWDKLFINIKEQYPEMVIKVICNTQDSLLYYEYERNNFFRLLELSKKGIVDVIAFLRKSQYELYKSLGYECYFLAENFVFDDKIKLEKNKSDKINLGVYPLNYTWDKNIFNQLCVGKMLNNCELTFNSLDERMNEFLNTMNIENHPIKIKEINALALSKEIAKNDVVLSASFTEYFHPVFFISMEMGVPCLLGNNSDLFDENDKLKKYIVTSAEDNAIVNAKMIDTILKNKKDILKLYREWKEKYNKFAKKNIKEFIEL